MVTFLHTRPIAFWLSLLAVGCGGGVGTSGDGAEGGSGGVGAQGGGGGTGSGGQAGGDGAAGFSAACPDSGGTFVRFDPTLPSVGTLAEDWLAHPFPADFRRTATGTIDVLDFPPATDPLFDAYMVYASEHLDGFGTNSPVYFTFSASIQVSALSHHPVDTLSPNFPFRIYNVTPGPHFGEQVPVRWELFEVDGKYVPNNTLAVAPAWGFPLRENNTYAAVVTRSLIDAAGHPVQTPPLLTELLGGALPPACSAPALDAALREQLESSFLPLSQLLVDLDIDRASIAAATVFTTQTITAELAEVRANLDTLAPPSITPSSWSHVGTLSFVHSSDGSAVTYHVMQASLPAPNYMVGDVPYVTEGGQFNFVGDEPQPYRWEDLDVYLTFPDVLPPAGDCFPIVEYAHGTGGSASGFTGATAGRFAARGLAGVGLDQPLHGDRYSQSSNRLLLELYTFNFGNPHSARTLQRQSAVETFWLTKLLRQGLTIPAADNPKGVDICFDPNRVAFFGHSQGGLSGAVAAAYEDGIQTYVLSGAGGGLSITLFERDDASVDPQALLNAILMPNPGETFTELHPVVGLIQAMAEVTDGINYAPYWADRTTLSEPVNLLVTSGVLDEQTPHRTAAALAVAARIPQVLPAPVTVPSYEAAGIAPLSAPVMSNLGLNTHTGGFMQWGEDATWPGTADHFVIFNRPGAINASMRLLESWAFEDEPRLERDPNSTAR